MKPFFEQLLECMEEPLFLQEFARKYRYGQEQEAALASVAASMKTCIAQDVLAGKAGWDSAASAGSDLRRAVCITLGPGIDQLQEDFLQQNLLSEAYMVETLASELLLKAYPQWNAYVAAAGDYRVRRYHFLGSDASYPLEQLPELLAWLQVPVTCTKAYCMLPKKSVAFWAELMECTALAADDAQAACEGICVGCGSSNCPNRMEKGHMPGTDMTDRPFTYGYSRIFGLS
ncbi:MAG: hypothetical protein IJ747_00095 [Lachnospiraceae bacterium]|nr:hypothetical protein [Lachnospiraceae bacterium]